MTDAATAPVTLTVEERTLPPQPEGPPSEAEMEQLATLARQYGGELLV